MATGKMSTWCHLTRSGLRLLCEQRFAYSLPFQVHISFTPRVFSSSLNKHPLIKSAGVDSVLHSDIQQGFWRNFSTCSAVQETHLHQRHGELFSCSTTESPHVNESKTVLDSGVLGLFSGFQNKGFRIRQQKFPGFWNPYSLEWVNWTTNSKYLISLSDRRERKMCEHAWKCNPRGATTRVYAEERQVSAVFYFFE